MKRQKKKYERPRRPWDKERIEKEREVMKNFGLRRKKEIWRAQAFLRKYRRIARELAAKKDKDKEKMMIKKLASFGLLQENAVLDDVLSLSLENVLERRLQTIIFRKGLAKTQKQARQFIVHRKVLLNSRKSIYPNYLVKKEEEDKIQVVK
ncbi:MAG TPA: 30S ribosomal protein S4 [archaeon]|nr:30S ribosomal protein S4 [archaeon]